MSPEVFTFEMYARLCCHPRIVAQQRAGRQSDSTPPTYRPALPSSGIIPRSIIVGFSRPWTSASVLHSSPSIAIDLAGPELRGRWCHSDTCQGSQVRFSPRKSLSLTLLFSLHLLERAMQ